MRPSLVVLLALALPLLSVGCKKSSQASAADGGAPSDNGAAAGSGASGLSILSGFEGEIDVTAKGETAGKNGAPQNLTVFVKSDKVRLDVPEGVGPSNGPAAGGKSWVVFDSPAKKLTMVNEAQRQAMTIDLNQKDALKMTPIGGGSHPGAPSSPPPKVTKTGKTDKVAGYTCEEWEIVNEKNEKGDLCVASEGASWFHLPSLGLPTERAWMAELVDGKHFPLRFVDFGADGKEKGRIEITKIEKKPIQAAQFEVPAGYRVMDLGQMFQHGIPGMPGPGGMPSGVPNHAHVPR